MDPFTIKEFNPEKAFQKIDVEKEAKIQSALTLLKTDEFKNSFLKELNESNDITFIKQNDEVISNSKNNSIKIFKSLYNRLIKTVNLYKFYCLENVNLNDIKS
tara:strand:- start:1437 stop:1745 length:309 start_codon:yes stop_codon:yes gene_type:complete